MKKQLDEKISIVIVEDHKIVRTGLRALIELEPGLEVVGEAENGLDAVKIAKHLEPQVVLMDISLPLMNGIDASRAILARKGKTRILILSGYSDDGYIEKARKIGIAGYLLKQCAPESLIKAIYAVASGKKIYSSKVLDRMKLLRSSSIDHRNTPGKSSHSILSPRESQVLQLVAEGKANKQAAIELEISIKTVEKHRQNLMDKLGIHDTAGLTRYAIAEGVIQCGHRIGNEEKPDS